MNDTPSPDEWRSGAAAADPARGLRVAVLIPCYNEEVTIGGVVAAFRRAIPDADIYVYDNNSADGTSAAAKASGAIVRHETQQGKGHVVRRMFADVEADIYLLVDGDGTYNAESAQPMIARLAVDGLDMVSSARRPTAEAAFRPGHKFGNRLLSGIVGAIFGRTISDMLSGYRVLSRRFVKSFPSLSMGFEIETEMTVHALELKMPIAEVEAPYRERVSGSASKLRTMRDGMRILLRIIRMVEQERPFQFFLALCVLLVLLSIGLAIPVVIEFVKTGLVPRLPTAVLAAAIMILAFLSLTAGLILETVTYGRREVKRLHYLRYPSPAATLSSAASLAGSRR
jgi:glycosyltransferase involved in cell wall biosynthesis